MSRAASGHDIVLLHDPELLLAIPRRARDVPIVWDVHEDIPASLIDRPWVPGLVRPAAVRAASRLEAHAERRCHLMLAEHTYVDRFSLPHPVVPNHPWLPDHEPPPPGSDRVVYVGRVAHSRGARELLELARRLEGSGIHLDLLGPVDDDVRDAVRAAHDRGALRWHGFVPNELALDAVEGAVAGLSLVHPQPNHAGSLQTKVLEYASRRVPVITTDLPVTGPFVAQHRIGHVVAVGDHDATEAAVRQLVGDAGERGAMADRGYQLIREGLNWDCSRHRFVALVERWACEGPPRQVPKGASG